MKNLTLIWLAIVVLPCCAYCQSNNSQPDTVVYGNVQNNFPGGQEAYNNYLSNNGSYPEPAMSNHIQGCVYVRLVIEIDGTISNVHLCDGAGSGMDETAIRLIRNSGKWVPSQVNGTNVRTHCLVPVRFSLSKREKPLSKDSIFGYNPDLSHFNLVKKVESLGIPVTEASYYIDKNATFMGEIYGTKALSDTVFILTCGNINQRGTEDLVNVALIGKGAFKKNITKQDLINRIVVSTGSVISSDGKPAILIYDEKKYRIIQPSSTPTFGKFLSIYDFGNW